MDITKLISSIGGKLPRPVAQAAEKGLRKLPGVKGMLDKEYAGLLESIEADLKPYRGKFPDFASLPSDGMVDEDIFDLMRQLSEHETNRWRKGYASGAVYHGDEKHVKFINEVYALNSQSNPLHADLWPSTIKYEAEIVSMTANMLGAQEAKRINPDANVCGAVTSGGTESILMAMKTYRDWARSEKGITRPEIVLPITAHPAFDKAAQYFGIKAIRTPIEDDFRADVAAMERAITRNTIALVGSAPDFPHGIIDPIPELSELAYKREIGFHTDACLGGFVLPWAEKLGYPVPLFDFRLPGVTSMSVDTHKYGYAAKGTSVVLYRTPELRRYQYFAATDWPGGLYTSPSMAGSRPGGLIAVCWAVMVKMGKQGYLDATRLILETADRIKQGIKEIPELKILGDPLWIIAFTSDELDIYRVLDAMAERGWSLNGLQYPPAVHIAITLRHAQPGIAERFLEDLRESVQYVQGHPKASGGMAPVYGMAASVPFRGMVDDLLRRYLDLLYKV